MDRGRTLPQASTAKRARTTGTFAWPAAAVTLTVGAALAFWSVALTRWRDYQTSAFDLAFFDQVIWNLSRGNGLGSTFIDYSFLGQHAEPVLLLFVPAYWAGAGPLVLTSTQNIAAAVAALLLFGAARRLGLSGGVALGAVAAYLGNAYLHRGLVFDFHPEVMVALPAFGAAWAIGAGRARLATVLALTPLLFKEDAVFVSLFLAVLLWAHGHRRPAAWAAVLAVGYAAIMVAVVMPIARGGADSDLVARFGAIAGGTSDREVIRAILTHPWQVPEHLLEDRRWWSIGLFIGCSAPLAVLRPGLLAAAMPGLLLASLSGHGPQHRLELHYAAESVPLIILAALYSARAMPARRRTWLPFALLGPAALGFLVLSPLRPWQLEQGPTAEHRRALAEAIALVPEGLPVGAQSNVLARLSQRREAYEFPDTVRRAEWFVFDQYGHRSTQSIAGGFDAERRRLESLTERVYLRDGVEVRRRIAPDPPDAVGGPE